MRNYVGQHNYPGKDERDLRLPDNTIVTVPGQSVSIKEMYRRYEKGRPVVSTAYPVVEQ